MDAGERAEITAGLREIASRLGAVLDLDVLLEAADQYRADLPVVQRGVLITACGAKDLITLIEWSFRLTGRARG